MNTPGRVHAFFTCLREFEHAAEGYKERLDEVLKIIKRGIDEDFWPLHWDDKLQDFYDQTEYVVARFDAIRMYAEQLARPYVVPFQLSESDFAIAARACYQAGDYLRRCADPKTFRLLVPEPPPESFENPTVTTLSGDPAKGIVDHGRMSDGDDYHCESCGESFDAHEARGGNCPMCGDRQNHWPQPSDEGA